MSVCPSPPDNWIPQTAREWYDWLLEEERKTVAAYSGKPSLLIAEYHRERAIARDYEGREVLELLQNANDQAAELSIRGRVLIDLTPNGLIVANTGLPFSIGGVGSLQTSHLSPKRHRRKQVIGNKGLGFRAVLNWSRTPIILSNALCVAYCHQHARDKVQALVDNNPALAQLVMAERQGSDALILPLLPFPLYSENGDLSARLDDDHARSIFGRCEALLIEGYDTVIGMPFDTPTGYTSAEAQIDEIGPEILLFAQHLGELDFHLPGKAHINWRREGNDSDAHVLENGKPVGRWHIHRKSDKLPESAVDADQMGSAEFEVVVAVPLDGTKAPGVLYSHFPTEIALPLPVVCHATLELEQNRKHTQQDRKCNRFVLGILAEFLTEIAEDVTANSPHDRWAGCALVMPSGEYSEELKREKFPQTLINAAKARKIVPTLSGDPVAAVSARSVAGADSAWLPPSLFPEVVPLRDVADARFLMSLNVLPLMIDSIKERIIAGRDLSVDQRVALVSGLLDHPELKQAYTSALLLDSSARTLSDGMRVFLPPSSGETPSLPDWAELRFLNQEMRQKLAARLKTRDVRELQQALTAFGLLEYSLGNVIRALVADANRIGKENPERATGYQADLLRSVLALYLAEEHGKKRPEYPEQSPLYFASQAGANVAATTLYFGAGFGPRGEITQSLYGPWARQKLLDATAMGSLTTDTTTLREFLLWAGVAQWPRDLQLQRPDGGYVDHTLRTIKFPATFEEKVATLASEARYAFMADVRSVDGLDKILANADPDAIAAWLAVDDRAMTWARPAPEHARLQAYPQSVNRPRTYAGAVPSHVRWCIETAPWLRSVEGTALRPKDCVLGERAIEELFPRPALPSQEVLERLGTYPVEILEGWRRAGVLTSLAYLERDEIYAKLLELPERSPDGKLARPLYQWLLDASDVALGGDGPNQKDFLASGRMWGHYGTETRYFPISELHHADAEGLPDTLLRRLKIVDLRKRVGADKVERLFGVKAVDRAGIQRRIIAKDLAPGSSDANSMFEAAKPYLHRLRLSDTKQLAQLQALKELQLEVCSALRVELTFEETSLEYDVPVWGWMIEDKALYVRSDPARPLDFAESLLSNAVCEALASVIFRIADGGDFARMLACREDDRLELLRRLRGDAALEDIGAIKAEYMAFKARNLGVATFPVPAPPQVVPAAPNATPPTHPAPNSDQYVTPPEGPLVIDEREHVPAPGPQQRALQVKTITTPGGPRGGVKHVTDGPFCERKAMEFEEASDLPRWPLLVGQVMGAEGPGCDILSFATLEAREAFRQGPNRDLNSVLRFIEVKGRGIASATIELRGNELSAAERYRDRYFLYRLFESEDGTFELSVLSNPLTHKEALRPAVHVGMEQASATQRFALYGGLSRQRN